MKKMIYISHPSGGTIENYNDAQKCLDILLSSDKIYENYCVVSPIQCYGGMYNTTDYNSTLGWLVNPPIRFCANYCGKREFYVMIQQAKVAW